MWCFSRNSFEFGLKWCFVRNPFLDISDRDYFREVRVRVEVGNRSILGPTACLNIDPDQDFPGNS